MARLFQQNRVHFCRLVLLALVGMASVGWAEDGESPVWLGDYREALAQAKAGKTMALLWFCDPQQRDENEKWEATVLHDAKVQQQLARLILVKLPLDVVVASKDEGAKPGPLLKHPSFAEMLDGPGLAMIDMRDETSPNYHHVVSVYPAVRQPISQEGLLAMLDLPSGSLTQRTLIWAVRTHRERPRSARAKFSSLLSARAESHSQHQASINVQGHHNWDQRFQDINSQLGNGMISREVCAESWPGQRLVEAAEECVHSWRQSSGHWEAVNGEHACFGYDMKLGAGGIWYATGIFGDRR